MFAKKTAAILSVCALLVAFSSCTCKHEWTNPTCTDPKTCTLCGDVEGAALLHNWKPATCTSPKICDNCSETEGEPMEHNWQDATPEKPKTCADCGATEGEKLNIDSRFNTDSTKAFYGTWSCDVVLTASMLRLEGYLDQTNATLTMEFTKTGELIGNIHLNDAAFLDAVKSYSLKQYYAPYLAQGFTEDEVDAYMVQTVGMTVEEHVNAIVDELDRDVIFADYIYEDVYYVDHHGLCSADSWTGEFECRTYTLDGDTLVIDHFTLDSDEPLIWTKSE